MKKELKPDELRDKVEALIDNSDELWDDEKYVDSIDLMLKAWDLLPYPKGDYEESYHLCTGLSETYLLMKDFKNAKRWSEEIYNCDLERADSGMREFLSGKVSYAENDFETAKKYFSVANEKSKGRCFESADPTYKKFFKSK